jgi:hypothetical protein
VLLAKYNWNDEVKEDEMVKECSMNWEKRNIYIGFSWESHRERDRKESQDIGGWIILKLILER